MKYAPLSFLALIAIFLGCSKEASQEVLKIEKPRANQVVLIFPNPVKNGFYTIPDGDGQSQGRTQRGDEIQYIDDQFIPRKASFNLNGKRDTVVIKTKRDFLEVNLMYKGVDDLRYVFKNGDTIEIRHEGLKPIAQIKNRFEDYSVTNYALVVRDSISKDDYRAVMIIDKPIMLTHRYNDSSKQEVENAWKEIINNATKNLNIEIEQELSLLNRLYESGQMSQDQFTVHVVSIHSELKRFLSFQKKDEESFVKTSFNQILNRLENQHPTIAHNRQDSLLYLMEYNKAMTTAIAVTYNKKVGRVKRTGKSAGVNIINYAKLYDSIRVNNYLTPVEKKIIQYNNVNGILSNGTLFGIESKLIYITRFKNDFEDSVLVAEIQEKYNVKFEIDDEIRLESFTGEPTTLEALMAANKGKIVYLDFWASWCAPCIKQMPSSKELTVKYKNEDVLFIYVSTDRRKLDWTRSIQKNSLNTGLHYRVTNANNSKGFEELNIPFIPRYMLYNKQGTLVNNDAPRPIEVDLLAVEFNKYLSGEN